MCSRMRFYRDVTEMVGRTPLLKLERLADRRAVYAKCEFMNPLSLKDRAVLQIIEDSEAAGTLSPGATLIECTSGNTGIGLALGAVLADGRYP